MKWSPSSKPSSALARIARMFIAAGLLAAGSAQANQVFTTDCAFGFKDDYGVDEQVCASGDVDTKPPGFVVVFPEGNVCVVRAGTLALGGGIADVTAGGCNTVVGSSLGGGFFDEIIWLPPLQRGLFQVVLDENQNGVYDGPDFAGNVFRVGDPVGANVNVAAIKGAAGAQFDHWDGLARHWHWVSDASTAISIGWAASSGDWVSVGVGVFGAVTGIPTDYNGAVLNIGGKVIEGLAAQQARRYKGLRDDPPDPNFTAFAALDLSQVNAELAANAALYPGVPLTYPFTARGSSAYERTQLSIANLAAEQSALVGALTTTIEKLQGAEAAGNDEYVVQQARALKRYADDLVVNLGGTRQALQDYNAEQTARGLSGVVYPAAEIAALVGRVNTSGLTAAEVTNLTNAGFKPADIDFLRARTAALAARVPAADFTRGQTLADLVAAVDAGSVAFQTLSDQAAAVIADRAPFVIAKFPVANAGGPYAGVQGVPIALSGAGSTDPNGDALTFEWDFNLDGVFGDAVGVAVNYVSGVAATSRVGLRVTDPLGHSSVAYAEIRVDAANQPPVIDTFAPASLTPVASAASPLAFSVSASDPDGDPLSFAWTLDGVPVATGANYVFTPAVGATGTRIVRVTVSDGNPLSPDAVEQRVVRIESAQPVLVPVPNVVGIAQASAETSILAAGLSVGTVTAVHDAVVPLGIVISQLPPGGTEVAAGTAVALVVSLGPTPPPPPQRCDADGDGDVDKVDLSLISRARGQAASGPNDPRDANRDGLITPADVQVCIRICTRPNCATQ